MSFLMKVAKFHVVVFLIALAILNVPFATDVKFSEFQNPTSPIYPEGNQFSLNDGERLFENSIRGPEGFAKYKNELYFSTHGGLIYKLVGDKLVKVLKTGKPCENRWVDEVKCGRPLGIKFDEAGILYIADCYNGIFRANLSTGTFDGDLEKLVSLDKEIAGIKPNLPNSLDLSKDGFVYWTDSSTKHRLHDGVLAFLADGDGRLIKLNTKTGENTVLMDNLLFANGVTLSKDQSFIVVAETGRARVHKYYLKGAKAGTSELFLENLPGYPDNLRLNDDGNIVISLINPFKPGKDMLNKLGYYPTVRKLLYKTLALFDLMFSYLNDIYPHYYFSFAQNWIGHFESLNIVAGEETKVFIVKDNGDVIKVHQGNDGKVSNVCDFIQHNGYFYLGSPFNNYLGRVKST